MVFLCLTHPDPRNRKDPFFLTLIITFLILQIKQIVVSGLRKFTLGNNGVEPTYEIMIEPVS